MKKNMDRIVHLHKEKKKFVRGSGSIVGPVNQLNTDFAQELLDHSLPCWSEVLMKYSS